MKKILSILVLLACSAGAFADSEAESWILCEGRVTSPIDSVHEPDTDGVPLRKLSDASLVFPVTYSALGWTNVAKNVQCWADVTLFSPDKPVTNLVNHVSRGQGTVVWSPEATGTYTLVHTNTTKLSTYSWEQKYAVEVLQARFVIESESLAKAALEAAVGKDGYVVKEDGVWTMRLTNDVTRTLELKDNLGPIRIDLNGHSIAGANGTDGAYDKPGTCGQPAIRILASGVNESPTELSLVTTAGPSEAVGGKGGDGNLPGDGGAGVEVAADALKAVRINVGADVTVRGGKGGDGCGVDAQGIGTAGGNGGAGVDGSVKTNDGTIVGGDGGEGAPTTNTEGGRGGRGGDAVTGDEGAGSGTTTGGNGGNGGDSDTGKGGDGGDGGAGQTPGEGGKGGTGKPNGQGGNRGIDTDDPTVKALREIIGESGEVVMRGDVPTIVLDEDLAHTLEFSDDLGTVGMDLNGHSITGACGTVGSTSVAGGDGSPAIRVVHKTCGTNEQTVLTILNSAAPTGGEVVGGAGGDGAPGGIGGAGILVADDTTGATRVRIGDGVTVKGGCGGINLKTGKPAEDGPAVVQPFAGARVIDTEAEVPLVIVDIADCDEKGAGGETLIELTIEVALLEGTDVKEWVEMTQLAKRFTFRASESLEALATAATVASEKVLDYAAREGNRCRVTLAVPLPSADAPSGFYQAVIQ